MIDEAGAAQHLLPESRRRKTITSKEIEAVVAKIARIPPKNVSKDDAEVLKDLDESLKRLVFGQDKAIEALASAIKLSRAGPARAGEADRQLPVHRPDRRRQDRGGEAAGRDARAWSCCASTCRSTWRSTPSAG